MKYYMGLDNGGTTTKAAIFDDRGKEIAVSGVSTAMIAERPGFVERDMEEMWEANCRVIRGVLEKSGVAPEDIAGVGICGHGKGLYLWGKDDKPLRNGIISSDNRAYAYSEKWKADGTEERAFQLTCQHIMACQPVALLAWLKDHEPESYKNIGWIFGCKDYVRFRLTGEARAERTDCSGTSLMNLNTRQYDKDVLAFFGLEDLFDALPPLIDSLDVAGAVTPEAAKLTGLIPGTPVIGGMFDIDACALAVGVADEKSLCMISGTWSINEYISKAPVMDGSVLMNSLFCLPGYYLIEESSPTSAGNNEWFIRQLLPELAEEAKKTGSIYDVMNGWVENIPAAEFVPVFLPFIMGSNVHPNAKGSFVGISANHTRRHLARGVYEGIAFCHKYHLDKLLASTKNPPDTIRLAGGAARSKVWTQIFADVMNMPVVTVNVNETGALGCAIAIAAATGAYPSLEDAIANMCSFSEPVLPNPETVPLYAKKYGLYRKTIECLDGLWTEMQDYIQEHS